MKKETLLVIFTYTYPYEPPIEQFLDDEIQFLEKEDLDILLVPVSREIKDNEYPIAQSSEKITTCKINRKNLNSETLIGVFQSVKAIKYIGNDWIRLIHYVQQNHKKSAAKETLTHYIQGNAFYSEFVKQIPRNISLDRKKIILYSYWFNPAVVAEALFKKSLMKKHRAQVYAYARAHGDGDLYHVGLEGYRPCLKLINDEIDAVFTISENGKELLCDQGIRNVEVHRLGVTSKNEFIPTQDKTPLIVSCSVINDNKRVERIPEILSKIHTNVRWIHFGSGPKEQELTSYCKEILPNNISWELRGWTEHNLIMDFYKNETPDLFINVSKVEGIPVSIMEAMAYSIPCIATNVGASNEIVLDGQNGMLIPADFIPEEIAVRIEEYFLFSDDTKDAKRKCAYLTYKGKYCSTSNYRLFTKRILS